MACPFNVENTANPDVFLVHFRVRQRQNILAKKVEKFIVFFS
ncbi:hypothetical protein VCR26J2_350416 [Vibrio coralliirubri]|nr:hypothetical protein VCR26J2_350416 [Vibrio coralliirubri]